MPIPAKLKVSTVELELMEARLYFKIYGTTCEIDSCAEPADNYHQSEWSLVWICAGHASEVHALSGGSLLTWERKVASQLYERMLQFSFVHQNHETGFALQEAVNRRAELEKEISKHTAKQRSAEQRELRKAIRETDVRVGRPDEELLIARQRQEARKQEGKPVIGAQRKDVAALIRPKLIVGTIPSKPRPEN